MIALELICNSFPQLKTLSLAHCRFITDFGIAHLAKLSKLERITLEGCTNTTDKSLSALSGLTQLRRLVLSCSPASLLQLDEVRVLLCQYFLMHVKGDGIAVAQHSIREYQNLVGDCNLSQLAELTNLQSLDTGPFMSLTTEGIRCLQKLKSLRQLRIQQCQLMDDERSATFSCELTETYSCSFALIGCMSSLVDLKLHKLQFVRNFKPVANLSRLQRFVLHNSHIKDRDLAGTKSPSCSCVSLIVSQSLPGVLLCATWMCRKASI